MPTRKAESLVFHGPYMSVSEYQLSTDLSPFLLVATVLKETATSLGILSQQRFFHLFAPAHCVAGAERRWRPHQR